MVSNQGTACIAMILPSLSVRKMCNLLRFLPFTATLAHSHRFTRPPMPAHPRLPDLVLILITLLWGTTFLAVQTALRWAGYSGEAAWHAAVLAAWLARSLLAGLTRHEPARGRMDWQCAVCQLRPANGWAGVSSSQSAFLTALYVPLVPLVQWGSRSRPALAAWLGLLWRLLGWCCWLSHAACN